MDVEGKIALVTGAASGIGFAYATELLRNGAKHVAILDLASSNGEESAKKLNAEFGNGKAIFIVCDVTKAQEFEAAFTKTVKEFGGLDIVINNAGIMDDARWELEININLTAVVRGTLLAFQYMGKDKGGKGGVVVNIASTAGITPAVYFPVYSGTKNAVIGASRSFGHPFHFEKSGVRVLTMCPHITHTQLITEGADRALIDNEAKDQLSGYMKTLSMQTPESVARGVIKIIKVGENGSVWMVSDGEPACELDIPNSPVKKQKA
ncbi:15-hydroxyprostaglandin dehydrogenase [NAD(+)]-like [Diprion similis]|uniref:15-hydroxyprostaglandin dehydrogenase [NAD(+)]-like n=1 Tax=Diprion similis TaxID=362088 RepID=UPI001EF87814|nr:15-hydroxyprostaglandin dehydrogenase [NAD(+)]-like [Diprion similis]